MLYSTGLGAGRGLRVAGGRFGRAAEAIPAGFDTPAAIPIAIPNGGTMVGMAGTLILALSSGQWAMLGFMVFLFVAVVLGYYTRRGSAIDQHPYHDREGDAPGAEIPSTIGRDVDRRDYQRGTR